MMNEKRFIGMYHNDSDLMKKIEDLKMQGIDGNNIYVVAEENGDVGMFKSKEYNKAGDAHESWLDRFMNFLTGENHVRGAMTNAGVPDADMDNYYTDIQNGGKLLYVDEGEMGRMHSEGAASFGLDPEASDPNLGANTVSEYDEGGLTGEVGQPKPGTTGAYQDSTLHVDAEESFGRAGGEALRNEMRYEMPPNNSGADMNRFDGHTEEEKMKLREERLQVDKEEVERGEVSLHKDVVSEQQSFDVPVSREEVYVERRTVNESETGDYTMQEDDETIRVPIMEERLEVTKKPYVAEEIVVGKRKVEDTEHVDETVRHEEARFEKTGDVEVEGDQLNDQTLRNKDKNEPF